MGDVCAWYSMVYLGDAGLAVMLFLPDRCLSGKLPEAFYVNVAY